MSKDVSGHTFNATAGYDATRYQYGKIQLSKRNDLDIVHEHDEDITLNVKGNITAKTLTLTEQSLGQLTPTTNVVGTGNQWQTFADASDARPLTVQDGTSTFSLSTTGNKKVIINPTVPNIQLQDVDGYGNTVVYDVLHEGSASVAATASKLVRRSSNNDIEARNFVFHGGIPTSNIAQNSLHLSEVEISSGVTKRALALKHASDGSVRKAVMSPSGKVETSVVAEDAIDAAAIADGCITNVHLNNLANISGSKLEDQSVPINKIVGSSDDRLSSSALPTSVLYTTDTERITAQMLQHNANFPQGYGSNQIANDFVQGDQIALNAIVAQHLSSSLSSAIDEKYVPETNTDETTNASGSKLHASNLIGKIDQDRLPVEALFNGDNLNAANLSGTVDSARLDSNASASLALANSALQSVEDIDDGAIGKSKLEQSVQDALNLAVSAVRSASDIDDDTIEKTKLVKAVRDSLDLADSALQSASDINDGTIAFDKLANSVQESLNLADTAVSTTVFNNLQSEIDDIQTQLDGKQASGAYLTAVPSATNASLIADGTVSNEEFQYLNGVKSNIQNQLDSMQPSGAYLTAVPSSTNAGLIADGTVSNEEFQYLNGVTSNIQSQLNSKQASGTYLTPASHIDGTNIKVENFYLFDATKRIQTDYLPSTVMYTSSVIPASRIANGQVTNTEFQYLQGLTSNIQTQIDDFLSNSTADTGKWNLNPFPSTNAILCHESFATVSTDFALKQSTAGATILNCKSNQAVSITAGDDQTEPLATFDTGGISFGRNVAFRSGYTIPNANLPTISDDKLASGAVTTDKIANDAVTADKLVGNWYLDSHAHVSTGFLGARTGVNHYALAQTTAGSTYVNCSPGQNIIMRQNNSNELMRMSGDGIACRKTVTFPDNQRFNCLGAAVFAIWAEESGDVGSGLAEWAFGNGANTGFSPFPGGGVAMCFKSRLIGLSLSVGDGSSNGTFTVQVQVLKNGYNANTRPALAQVSASGVSNFGSAYNDLSARTDAEFTYEPGDVVGFRTGSVTNADKTDRAVVTAWFQTVA